MDWNAVVARVTPYIVRIDTPDGHGTGFMCFYNPNKTMVGIATASHVVSHADEWQQPIRLLHFPSEKNILLKEGDRVIFDNRDTDSAVILVPVKLLEFPAEPIKLLPPTVPLNVGTEVGWLGYPGISAETLCFFSGIVSARQDWRHSYLLDGVAINGVSGGPVVYSTQTDGVQIIGIVSAYISNKTTPGLAMARDVSHFHDTLRFIKDFHEARDKKEKEEQVKKLPSPPEPAKEERKNE